MSTHRQFLLQLLKRYKQTVPSDEEKIVSENQNCFEREPEDGAKHIAASVLLITRDFKEALFLWHTKIGKWTQPGGHADGNPDLD